MTTKSTSDVAMEEACKKEYYDELEVHNQMKQSKNLKLELEIGRAFYHKVNVDLKNIITILRITILLTTLHHHGMKSVLWVSIGGLWNISDGMHARTTWTTK